MTVHPIEEESYRILAGRVDLGHLQPGPRAVVERVIHASADLSYARTMVVPPEAVAAGVNALALGAPVVADVTMTAAGITTVPSVCLLPGARAGPGGHPTRSVVAMRQAAARFPEGAVFVVGCAPTALDELVRLAVDGDVRPALIVGVPVGFVGAAESKHAVRRTGLTAITNTGEKGGAAVAAAIVNALARLRR